MCRFTIDAKKQDDGRWTVVINGGRTDIPAWMRFGGRRKERLGAGEIVLNAIDTTG